MSDQVWSSKLDSKYDVVVVRNPGNEYQGTLRISEGDNVLLEETVPLAYGAVFGPDVDDVALWQERAVIFVDGLGDK